MGKAFQNDKTQEGWVLVEDVAGDELFPPDRLELIQFLAHDEEGISGEELVPVAKRWQACLGQRQAEYILEHLEEIPPEWCHHILVFPGTIWLVYSQFRYFPVLRFNGYKWELGFRWLGCKVYPRSRLLRPRKTV